MVIDVSKDESTLVFDADRNGRAFGAVAHGIFEQVAEDAIDARRVAGDAPVVGFFYMGSEAQPNVVIPKRRGEVADGALSAVGEVRTVACFLLL